ncbi:MAG: hypothetical protein H7242_09500 [Microbacteriaceae bacterium]|nr:hypothetical protein [Burkholderiaceae bacterium]
MPSPATLSVTADDPATLHRQGAPALTLAGLGVVSAIFWALMPVLSPRYVLVSAPHRP